jgi:hypothetical protein
VTSIAKRATKYGVMIDEDDLEKNGHARGVWAFECFPDGVSVEKRMDDVIITAANCALLRGPNGEAPKVPDGYHYSWFGLDAFEDPKRPQDA